MPSSLIPFHGTLTYQHFKFATLLSKRFFMITTSCFIVLFLSYLSIKQRGINPFNIIITLLGAVIAPLLYLYSEFRAIKSTFNKTVFFKYPLDGSVSDEAFLFHNEIVSFTIPLTKIVKVKHDDRIALVFWGDDETAILSKDFFESETAWKSALERLKPGRV